MPVSYEVRGLDDIMKRVNALDGVRKKGADKIIGAHARREAARLRRKRYPPKLPNQQYIRTGRLGRSFFSFRRGGAYGVRNDTPYGIWVIWRGSQAPIHAGRWWTFQREIESKVKDLKRKLSTLLKKKVS